MYICIYPDVDMGIIKQGALEMSWAPHTRETFDHRNAIHRNRLRLLLDEARHLIANIPPTPGNV
jgi:hypothetical protein